MLSVLQKDARLNRTLIMNFNFSHKKLDQLFPYLLSQMHSKPYSNYDIDVCFWRRKNDRTIEKEGTGSRHFYTLIINAASNNQRVYMKK